MPTARDLIADLVERLHALDLRITVLESNRRANAAILAACAAILTAPAPLLLPYCHTQPEAPHAADPTTSP